MTLGMGRVIKADALSGSARIDLEIDSHLLRGLFERGPGLNGGVVETVAPHYL